MTVAVRNIRIPLHAPKGEMFSEAEKRLKAIDGSLEIKKLEIFKKSVDTRHRTIYLVYSVLADIDGEIDREKLEKADCYEITDGDPFEDVPRGNTAMDGRPLVVGFGPCGMFAALCLAEQGFRPIVIERGEPVALRLMKVAKFMKTGILDTESNIQFGAGGAGTFSDGKLVTRINDRKVSYVLHRFVEFGAPNSVLTEAKPHIGTDRLLTVVSRIDSKIKELGGEIYYGTRMERLIFSGRRVEAVETNNGTIRCGAVILAIGNSSRDTYGYLLGRGCTLQPKPFSVGVRIEHLQSELDRAVFGSEAGNPLLGHAEYAMSHRRGEDCVYTFCMCPGGEVIASASEEGGVVTNGMSRYLRNGSNANAALVVNVAPQNPIEYQRGIECKAFHLGGGNYTAPAQTVGDYLNGRKGSTPKLTPTYRGGKVNYTDLSALFEPRINSMLKLGLKVFDEKIRGFADSGALLTGAETRTSAPFRILRDAEMLSPDAENLYPGGEGAGYAGGISSSAVDGVNIALKILEKYKSE